MQQKQILNISHVDTSSFALKSSLASLKTEVDKLVPVPVDLSKLSDVVKNDVVKKTVYDKLVAKVNSVDATIFDIKSNCDTDKSEIEKKILILVILLKRQITIVKLLK